MVNILVIGYQNILVAFRRAAADCFVAIRRPTRLELGPKQSLRFVLVVDSERRIATSVPPADLIVSLNPRPSASTCGSPAARANHPCQRWASLQSSLFATNLAKKTLLTA